MSAGTCWGVDASDAADGAAVVALLQQHVTTATAFALQHQHTAAIMPLCRSLSCNCPYNLLRVLCLLLQLQEKILEWFKNGSWQEIVAEKRSVLTSMQQVLQSCYALLDSTQVPVNSIIKLLQHILRCGSKAAQQHVG